MGGTIEVTSELDKGSTFSFVLPFIEAHESQNESEVNEEKVLAAPIPLAERRILLAEDDPEIRDLMKIVLGQRGCKFIVTGSGKKTLSRWEKDSFDVILLDIQMPDMDGFEVLRLIREQETKQGKHTFVIALTAHAFPEFKKRCLDAGKDGHISKPISIKDLFE